MFVRVARPKPQPPPIEAAVETLARLVSQTAKSENFKVVVIADASGYRHEITLQHAKRRWK